MKPAQDGTFNSEDESGQFWEGLRDHFVSKQVETKRRK